MKTSTLVLVVTLAALALSGCTSAAGQDDMAPEESVKDAAATPGQSAIPSEPDGEWYPPESTILMKPAVSKSGSGDFDVRVYDREYTKYFVCHGSGEIRVSDAAKGKAAVEPEVWPCNGVPVQSVTAFDEPGVREIKVEVTKPAESDWSLVAVKGVPDGLAITED